MRQVLVSCTIACVVGVGSLQAQTRDVELLPLSDHLAEFSQDSLGVFRYLGLRCGSLYALASGQVEAQEPELGADFLDGSIRFMQMATKASEAIGASEADALKFTAETMGDIADLYQDRLKRNMAARGTYWVDDPLIRDDLSTCKLVAESVWGGEP